MATTPNFLWLEAVLRHARQYLAQRPDSPLAAHYLESIVDAIEVFRRTRTDTDRTYLVWRNAFNDVIAAHKAIRLAFDEARRQCVEWGLEGYPQNFVSYMDEENTQQAALGMIAFLERAGLEADWVAPAIQAIKDRVADALTAIDTQKSHFKVYKGRVRERKIGYDRGYELTREFFGEVKGDLERNGEDFRRLSPYPIT